MINLVILFIEIKFLILFLELTFKLESLFFSVYSCILYTHMARHCCICSSLCCLVVLQPHCLAGPLEITSPSRTLCWSLDIKDKKLFSSSWAPPHLRFPRSGGWPRGWGRRPRGWPLSAWRSPRPSPVAIFYLQIFIIKHKIFRNYQQHLDQRSCPRGNSKTLRSISSRVLWTGVPEQTEEQWLPILESFTFHLKLCFEPVLFCVF